MKNPIRVLACLMATFTTCALAQTASVSADTTNLAPSGGAVVVTAQVAYEGKPGAVGVAIEIPTGWTLVKVSGENVPAIAPAEGSAGTLEFAYAEVPTGGLRFSLVLAYPKGAPSARLVPTVLVRSGGKLSTVRPSPISFLGQ